MFKIAAFPKCWIPEICSGKLSLWKWVDMATPLGVEGLELYSGFLENYKTNYLKRVRRYIAEKGLAMPMMCYSPDFTRPEKKNAKKRLENRRK